MGAGLLSGCAMVGPDFQTPPADLNPSWLASGESRVAEDPTNNGEWWRTFDDPALNRLIEIGYAQNLPLQVAGARVLQARAQLAVTIGEEYPQTQQAVGALQWTRESAREPRAPEGNASELEYTEGSVGVQASWELDFWGKFRRSVEVGGRAARGHRRQLRRRPGQPDRRSRQRPTSSCARCRSSSAVAAGQREGAAGGPADRDHALSAAASPTSATSSRRRPSWPRPRRRSRSSSSRSSRPATRSRP